MKIQKLYYKCLECDKNVYVTVWNVLKTVASVVWNAILKAITTAVTNVYNFIMIVWNQIAAYLQGYGMELSLLQQRYEPFSYNHHNCFHDIMTIVMTIWTAIWTFLSTI
ncbi:hypothetical protein HIL16_15130 [Staphylococcus aureus]|nr:hypothetical protein [Staphylococcus aureus]